MKHYDCTKTEDFLHEVDRRRRILKLPNDSWGTTFPTERYFQSFVEEIQNWSDHNPETDKEYLYRVSAFDGADQVDAYFETVEEATNYIKECYQKEDNPYDFTVMKLEVEDEF